MQTRATLNIMAHPPQLKDLARLLNLQANFSGEERADLVMGEKLPKNADWLNAKLAAHFRGGIVPPTLPALGGPSLAMALRLKLPAQLFPMDDINELKDALVDAIEKMEEQLLPHARSMSSIPNPALSDLAQAARITLDLRAQGLCPFEAMEGSQATSKVGAQAGMGISTSAARFRAAMQFSAHMQKIRLPSFGLPPAQLKLAADLAAINDAVKNGPVEQIPDFAHQIRKQIEKLMQVPVPNMRITPAALMAAAAELADLDTIHEAFGEDAFTPQGQIRINAMFRYWSQIRINLPSEAIALNAKLEALPDLSDVLDGARAVNTAGPMLAASMSATLPTPPVLPIMEVLSALAAAMSNALKMSPTTPCNTCGMPMALAS